MTTNIQNDWPYPGSSMKAQSGADAVPIIPDNSQRLSGRIPEIRLIDDAELLLTIHAAQTRSVP